ncbi:MAG: phosphoribosylformylglycinamidine synthase subunit PurQ, partial [Gemmatimonadales bacterium]
AVLVDYRDTGLHRAEVVILPGGFAYGDYLRSGAIARFAPVMTAVKTLADAGGTVIGICNGFQVLCEAQLLPGALQRNAQQRFASRPVDVRIERNDTACTADYATGEVIRIPIAHGEGRFVADPATLMALEAERRVLLRYVAVRGSDLAYNPNGSSNAIAGVCNPAGNVAGIMPHPERLADTILGSDAGRRFFSGLVRCGSIKVAA